MLEEWGRNFEDCFMWEVGNGKAIKFWEDRWVGNVALKCKFPRSQIPEIILPMC